MEGDWLAWLLRVGWMAGTFPILMASIPSSRLSGVNEVLSGFANRGKTRQTSSQVCLHILCLRSFGLVIFVVVLFSG